MIKLELMRSCFLGMSKEMESTPDEDAVKIVEMTPGDLQYSINIVDKTAALFQRIDSSFERSSVGKMLSTCIICYREKIVLEKIASSYP